MRSGHASALARRIERLARKIPVNRRAEWRAYLAECFAAPEYDAHRDAIIEALCSDMPHYHFTGEYNGAPAFYMVSWWNRDEGGAPYRRSIVRGSRPLSITVTTDTDGERQPPPAVHVYSGEWADKV